MVKHKNEIILSLGSNLSPRENIGQACNALKLIFPDIIFSEAVYTKPYNWHCEDFFLNCVAVATTDYIVEELLPMFKALEKSCGRTPESKLSGRIPLDVDLLQWNGNILKPDDMQRIYVKEALLSIRSELQKDKRRQ